jgi:hypothetical protein
MSVPPGREKNRLLALIRNAGNMEAGLHGVVKAARRAKGQEVTVKTHSLCPHCKAYIKRSNMWKHRIECYAKKTDDKGNALMNSLIYAAGEKKYGMILNKLRLKDEVLTNMRADDDAEELLEDVIIISWGDDLLKKVVNGRNKYHIAAKMRLCFRFVKAMRTLNEEKYTDMLSCLKASAFDDTIEACKLVSKFDKDKKTYGSASNALHLGNYLKQMCDLATKIVLRKQLEVETEEVLKDLKRYRSLIATQWTTEVSSLAKKDLQLKRGDKPQLIPLTEDVMKLKKLLDQTARTAFEQLKKKKTREDFKTLVETTLASTILFNRKRVGDLLTETIDPQDISQ